MALMPCRREGCPKLLPRELWEAQAGLCMQCIKGREVWLDPDEFRRRREAERKSRERPKRKASTR